MLDRRWFVDDLLLQWKQMVAAGDYRGPFCTFPHEPNPPPEPRPPFPFMDGHEDLLHPSPALEAAASALYADDRARALLDPVYAAHLERERGEAVWDLGADERARIAQAVGTKACASCYEMPQWGVCEAGKITWADNDGNPILAALEAEIIEKCFIYGGASVSNQYDFGGLLPPEVSALAVHLNEAAERETFLAGCYTNTSTGPLPTLTLDALMDSVARLKGVAPTSAPGMAIGALLEGRSAIPLAFSGAWPMYLPSFDGRLNMIGDVPVRTSEFLGEPCDPRNPPVPRFKPGPHFRRRIKRWERAHPNRTCGKGEYFVVEDREIWCHPEDLEILRKSIKNTHNLIDV